jgi:hypothetical protein
VPPALRFIYKLSAHPKKLAEFRRNSRRAVAQARLSASDRKAILSRDAARIRKAIHMRLW